MSQEECARLREIVPYVKLYRYNPKHLYPKLNGYGDNGQWSLKLWQLLHTYWLPNSQELENADSYSSPRCDSNLWSQWFRQNETMCYTVRNSKNWPLSLNQMKISVIFHTTNGYLLEKFISVVPPQLSRSLETVLTLICVLFHVCMF